MRQLLNGVALLLLVFLTISCGSTKKVSTEALEGRITSLEEQNASMRKEMEVMKSQIRILLNNLPKPGTNPNSGGARPQDSWNNGTVAADATTIEFEKTIHDFGTLKSGESVSYTFKFKNTGQKPLLISNAKGSCGCTVPKYPKHPIPPGGKGEIQVTFNSKGKKGKQHKSVTLTANTSPESTRLYIKADVNE